MFYKTILDLCGGTGAWSKPYKEAGYNVILVDLPNDVRLFKPPKKVYGILAAPPCTHLAGSGARWWKEKGTQPLLEALSIVDACIRIVMVTKPHFWVLENPVGRLVHYLGPPKTYFQPYEYGNTWSKKTALWGKFIMPKKNIVEPTEKNKIWYMSGPNRSKLRSITPSGFAKAFYEANK
jgi:site-specific DNA-cytosine methylase